MSQANNSALISQIRSEIEELHAIAASLDARSVKLTINERFELFNLTRESNNVGFHLEALYEELENLTGVSRFEDESF
jgi:hypothetical protein